MKSIQDEDEDVECDDDVIDDEDQNEESLNNNFQVSREIKSSPKFSKDDEDNSSTYSDSEILKQRSWKENIVGIVHKWRHDSSGKG